MRWINPRAVSSQVWEWRERERETQTQLGSWKKKNLSTSDPQSNPKIDHNPTKRLDNPNRLKPAQNISGRVWWLYAHPIIILHRGKDL